jgi:hypothetical protein
MRQKPPALPQRTAPGSVLRILAIPSPDLNASGARAQPERVPVPMHESSLALGGKPGRVDRPVAVVFLASVAASILGPQPTPRLRSPTATGLVPLGGSWCLCLRWVIVHSTLRNRTL